jgi:hypothetical protein
MDHSELKGSCNSGIHQDDVLAGWLTITQYQSTYVDGRPAAILNKAVQFVQSFSLERTRRLVKVRTSRRTYSKA